jgi:hypothetical protein
MRTPLAERAYVNGKYTFNLALARAKRYRAFPRWANTRTHRAKILKIYIAAQYKNLTTKRKWHVDHIIPLYGETICGLHVAENLRVISKEANIAKSNIFIPYFEKKGKRTYLHTAEKRWYAPRKGKANPTKKSLQKMAPKIIFNKRNFYK